MRVVIHPSERGVLWRSGAPVRWLDPGSHFVWGTVTRYDLDQGATPWSPELASILPEGAAELVGMALPDPVEIAR